MNTKNRCPRCGKTLPPDAPEGICPACLAKAYLQTETTHARQVAALPVATLAALFPDLEILELIGPGGMGAVYKARQPKLEDWSR